MKRELSDFTRNTIEELFVPVPLWRRVVSVGDRNEKVRLLSLIAKSGEAPAIGSILGFLFASEAVVRQAAADAIFEILKDASPDDYLWLELSLRRDAGSHDSRWQNAGPSDLVAFRDFGPSSTSALGIASFHWSGYVRDAALQSLDAIGDGSELPFLLLRVNDWVPEVRATAERVVLSRITPKHSRAFARNLPLVLRLHHSERVKGSPIVEMIEDLIVTHADDPALLESMNSSDRRLRRMSFRIALKADVSRAIEAVLHHRDPIMRTEGVRALADHEDSAFARRLLETVRNDRSSIVRLSAFEVFATRFSDEKKPWLERALLDESKAIRGWAQFESRELLNVLCFYRRYLSSENYKILASALGGLGEVGMKEDAAEAEINLTHSAARVRRAAVRLLSRIEPESHLDDFLLALTDKSSRVSREAALALTKIRSFDGALIWDVMDGTTSRHVKTNGLLVIARLRKWESIPYLIAARASADPQLKAKASEYIRRWQLNFNKVFTEPSTEQRSRLRDALAKFSIEPQLRTLIERSVRV